MEELKFLSYRGRLWGLVHVLPNEALAKTA
jgi:hypothetical protein